MATIIIDNSSYVTPREDEHIEVKAGDFLTETLRNDTRVWEVIKTTAKTITVRSTRTGNTLIKDIFGDNPYIKDHSEALTDEDGTVHTLRERKGKNGKGGRYGIDPRRPMRPAKLILGRPTKMTDYRY